jgi:hypothetical protein
MKEAMKKNAPFQNEGIMSISKALATNVDSKVNKIVEGAKRQGIDFDKYNEQEVKYILELNKPKGPRVISADSPEGRGITEALLGRKEGKVIKADFGKPFKEEVETMRGGKKFPTAKDPDFKDVGPFDNDAEKLAEIKMSNEGFIDDIITDIKQMEPIDSMKEANKVLKGEGRYKNLSQADREKIVNDESVTDHIFERQKPRDADDPNYDAEPADFDPDADNETFAIGGRAGFKMGRRAFLKLMGGAAAGIGALKAGALKMFGKEGAEKIPQVVTTPPAPGKPAWFDSLVNKVIREGDDVTKQFATKEREIVHIKKIDEDSTVTVTQDLDEGIVRVEYDSADNVFADTVQLQYKKPLPDEGNPNPQAEFTTAESGPVGRQVGPDDYDIDKDEVGGTSIKDLDSDVSKLKEYATGKKLTMKEIVEAKRRRDKALAISENIDEAQLDAVTSRQGEMLDDQDFASGGRVGLLSGGGLKGGGVLRVILQNLAKQYGKKPSELLSVTNYKSLPVEVRRFLTKEQFEAVKKDMQEQRIAQFKNLRDMVENRQKFDKSAKALEKMGMNVSDTILPIMDKGVTPGGTTADDLLMMEQIIKNLQMKDRKLNASGGLAGMLGE